MSRAGLRRRVAALNEAINPAGALSAKLAKLSDEQRHKYQQWQQGCIAYFAALTGGAAYARLISGEQLPPLRPDIHRTLFCQSPLIAVGATIAEAAEIYRHFVFGD